MAKIFAVTVVIVVGDGASPETVSWLQTKRPTTEEISGSIINTPVSIVSADVEEMEIYGQPYPLLMRGVKAAEDSKPSGFAGAVVNPESSRMNELDRAVRNVERNQDQITAALAMIMARLDGKPANEVNAIQARVIEAAAPKPAGEGIVPPSGVTDRRFSRGFSEEMNGRASPQDAIAAGGNMSIIGATPTTTIERLVIDGEGKARIVAEPMPTVGDTLRR